MAKSTLDTSVLESKSAEMSLTTETIVTLYVIPGSGRHSNHRVTLQFSPDGVDWVSISESVNGTANSITVDIVASKVRACVCEAEGDASEVIVHILAR